MLHGFCPSLGSHQGSKSVIILYRCVWLLCSNLGTTDIIETSKQPRHHPWGIQGLCKNAVTAKSYIRCVLKRSAIAFMTRFSFDLEKRFSKCFSVISFDPPLIEKDLQKDLLLRRWYRERKANCARQYLLAISTWTNYVHLSIVKNVCTDWGCIFSTTTKKYLHLPTDAHLEGQLWYIC